VGVVVRVVVVVVVVMVVMVVMVVEAAVIMMSRHLVVKHKQIEVYF
jgi:hypothetical protein